MASETLAGDDGALKVDRAAVLALPERLRLLGFAGLLLLLVNLAVPSGGLISIPVTFFAKNRLHLSAHALALFNLWIGLPLYGAFLFGFLRDRWSPFDAGDRGHLVFFGLLTAALFVILAFLPPTYGVLLVGLLAITAALQTAAGSANALFSGLGQRYAMTGQSGAVLSAASLLPLVIGYLLGGLLSGALEGTDAGRAARALFLVGAALMFCVSLGGAFGPAALFEVTDERLPARLGAELGRLFGSWPVWPPVIMLTLWNFAPCFGVALQYQLANAYHASDAEVGGFYAVFYACQSAMFLVYGLLCQRVSLHRLLIVGTLLGIGSMVPLLLIHSPAGALLWAIPVGMTSGIGTASYFDLAIRSCPKGLHGTMMLLAIVAPNMIAQRFGDLLGTAIYEHAGGFAATVWLSTAVYVLILPVIFLTPRRLTRTTDGEAAPAAA